MHLARRTLPSVHRIGPVIFDKNVTGPIENGRTNGNGPSKHLTEITFL